MGQKLGAFLRVLGSGLSQQAFQANVGLYGKEKAEENRIAGEERTETSNIKQLGIKQAFANLGVLGVAAKKANETGDTEQSHKIGLAAKEIFSNIDPRYRNMAQESFMAFTLKDTGKKGESFAAIDQKTNKEFMAVENEQGQIVDAVSGKHLPNAFKAPTKTETRTGPLTKSGKNKLALSGIEGEQNVRNNVRNIGELIKTVASPDFLGGNLGNAVQALNSARAQVGQLFGGEEYLTDDGELNPQAFKTGSKFRKMAIEGNVAESQTLELAFIMAKALNPDGKISDADVRQAGKILGDSADPKVRSALLRKVQNRIVDRYNSDQKVVARHTGGKFTPLKLDKLLGAEGFKSKTPTGGDAATNILNKVGFP